MVYTKEQIYEIIEPMVRTAALSNTVEEAAQAIAKFVVEQQQAVLQGEQ